MKYSDSIIKWLKQEGYTHCFFVAGGNIMHLLNSVRTEMVCIPFVHEVGAAIAVESFNEINNDQGGRAFALVTAGPGLTNAVTGIAGAWLESRELLIIGGQVKSTDLSSNGIRQRGIQEIDGVSLVKSITKEAVLFTAPQLESTFKSIVRKGSAGRKGPVFIEICLDVQGVEVLASQEQTQSQVGIGINSDLNEIKKVANIIKAEIDLAERPVILIGGGISPKTSKPLLTDLEKMDVVLMTTWNGADRVPSTLRNYFGRPNTWGQRYSNVLIQQSDLIIALGTRLGLQQTGFAWEEFAPLARIIQIDIDSTELQKSHPKIEMGYSIDANRVLEALVMISTIQSNKKNEWLNFAETAKSLLPTREIENRTGSDFVDPYRFGIELSSVMDTDSILIPCSSGSSFTALMQTFTQRDTQRVISSKGLASMGYGLSTAIGAALNRPKNSVFLVEGDGGFAQNLQELGTISANKLNIKIFIFSNQGYASIRMTQKNYFGGAWIGCDSETGLGLPDWELIAKSYGISYLKMNAQGFSDSSLISKLNEVGPILIEVPIDPEQTFYPKITSVIQEDGSMKSNPLHLMSPELPESISSRVLKYLNV
jgi:acetolactate synthase-1/2/3 large subunit